MARTTTRVKVVSRSQSGPICTKSVTGKKAAALRRVAWLAALFMACGSAAAADLVVKKHDLFTARQGGYHTYRIPGMVITLDGTMLAYVAARDADIWDYGNYDTVLRRSTDGGKTWSPMEVLVDAGTSTVDNCVLIVDKKRAGVVHHLYCLDYARTCYRRSTDHGRTFSPATEIAKPFADFAAEYPFIIRATGPGHGIQLDSGRLLVPVWLSPSKQQFPSAVSVIYSDDHGDTWSRGPIVVRSGDPATHPMEGVVAQLRDGRVMMNIRNESEVHRRAVAFSPNGVTDWTVPEFDPQLREPICFGSLLAAPREIAGRAGVLLFSNPDNVDRSVEIGPKHYCDRKNLTVKLSLDDGADWAKSLVIEPDFSGYSDLCVSPDGTVYCLYERGAITSYYDPAAVAVASFDLRQWLPAIPERRDSE
jgi:sialidase-1